MRDSVITVEKLCQSYVASRKHANHYGVSGVLRVIGCGETSGADIGAHCRTHCVVDVFDRLQISRVSPVLPAPCHRTLLSSQSEAQQVESDFQASWSSMHVLVIATELIPEIYPNSVATFKISRRRRRPFPNSNFVSPSIWRSAQYFLRIRSLRLRQRKCHN